jgi:hypothetical protein
MLDGPESASTGPDGKPAKDQLHGDSKDPTKTQTAKQNLRAAITTAPATAPAPAAGQAAAPAAAAVRLSLTLALFDHPLIKAQQSRRVRPSKQGGTLRNPQYLSSKIFLRALVDTLLPDAVDPNTTPPPTDSVLVQLHKAVYGLPCDPPLKRSLLALITQAEGDLSKFEASVENWYDAQMARISGWYKRWSRVILGGVGLIVAVLVNIDTVQVAHGLYVDAPVRQAVVSAADAGTLCQGKDTAAARQDCAKQELATLNSEGLPIGYSHGCAPLSHPARCFAWSATTKLHWWDSLLRALGWAITAFAVSFGAPFWFDALSKLGSLRNAGPKPATT